MEDLIEIHDLIEDLLEVHRSEIESRHVIVRRDIEPGLGLTPLAGLRQALGELFGFALSTLPDDCELYWAAMRSSARLAAVGRGEVHLRWQVMGVRGDGARITRIRPRSGRPGALLESAAARRLRTRFDIAGVRLMLEASDEDDEIRARVEIWATPDTV